MTDSDKSKSSKKARSLDSIASATDQIEKEVAPQDKLPPVHLWHPEHCGDIDIKITRDGRWFHEGGVISRPRMVKMFSRILRHDDDGFYYLVTPVEKMKIVVEDAPFVAVELVVTGKGADQVLTFTTNVGDLTIAGADHPIRVVIDPLTQEPSPYIHVRDNLDALISRSVYYDLVAMAEEVELDGKPHIGIRSSGEFYSFGLAEA